MNKLYIMSLNEREKRYFDYLESLTPGQFNSVIHNEIRDVFNFVRNPEIKVKKSPKLTGIFRKTTGCIKCASGVRFGKI